MGLVYLPILIFQKKSTIHVGKHTVRPVDPKGNRHTPKIHLKKKQT